MTDQPKDQQGHWRPCAAASLSEDQKKEIARKAASARWNSHLPKATHEGVMQIGNVGIACAVLEDGRRLITQSGFMLALGRARQAKGRDI